MIGHWVMIDINWQIVRDSILECPARHAQFCNIFQSGDHTCTLKEMEVMFCCYIGWPKNNGTVDFLPLCSDQQLSFFTLLDGTSFPHYNNTKNIKFSWKLFILWVISYGLSFSGFAINFSLVGGPQKNGTVNFLGLCSDEQLFFHLAG